MVRILQDVALRRKPGQMRMSRAGRDGEDRHDVLQPHSAAPRRPARRHDQRLIAAEVDREDGTRASLDDIEIAGFCVLLGGAGAETVAKWVGTAAVLFVATPTSGRNCVPTAARSRPPSKRCLRHEGPVQYDCRYTMRDVDLHGTTIPAGSAVMLLGASANRDERAFTNADTFDIDRDRSRGPEPRFRLRHPQLPRCGAGPDGSALALEYLLDFMPEFQVEETSAGGDDECQWL